MEFYYQDQIRWAFGFDNPNKAAALIASILPLLWIVANWGWHIQARLSKWVTVLIASATLWTGWWLLFMTFSRGGIVAAVSGFFYIGWQKKGSLMERQNRMRLVLAMAGALVVTGLFAGTNAAERSTQWIGQREGSVENRFELWSGGTRMLAQIPRGVGTGNSGAAYMQWFQPLDSTTRYRTMVNSYLTLAVEQGLGIFALTVFAAMLFWQGTNINPGNEWLSGAVIGSRASLLAFAVAGFFSTTMEDWRVWVAPGISIVLLILIRSCFAISSEKRHFTTAAGIGALFSAGLCLALYFGGWALARNDQTRVGFHHGDVQIIPQSLSSGQPARNFQVLVDEEVLGSDYGKLLRRLAIDTGAEVHIGGEIPSEDDVVIASGEAISRLHTDRTSQTNQKNILVLIAPEKLDGDAAEMVMRSAKSVTLFTPSFDEDGRAQYWNEAAERIGKPVHATVLDGVGIQVESAWEDIEKAVAKLSASAGRPPSDKELRNQ